MPERRIDAIGKADAASWNTTHISKGSPNLLRIISGQLSHMPVSEVMSAVVQKAAKGAFKITLNGETFIIKGMPASLQGKAVSFVARQAMSAGKSGIELFWLGPSRASSVAAQTTTQAKAQPAANITPQQAPVRANILSGLSAELLQHSKSGNIINGRIDTIQAGKMTVSIALPDSNKAAKSISHQIQTTLVHGLKQGQHFSARIQTDSNNKAVLEILSQTQLGPAGEAGAGKAAPALQMASFTLAEGDVVPAMVQKRLPNGHIQLSIQGITVETPAPKSIAQGDVLVLRMHKSPAAFQFISVHKNAAEKAMTVVKNNLAVSHEPVAQNMASMRNMLPMLTAADMPEIEGMTQLGAWLSASALEQEQPVNGERLARIIRASGAGLEAKLLALSHKIAAGAPHNTAIIHDLKMIMLQLSRAKTSSINHAQMIKVLTELAQHSTARIETLQALNVLAHMQGDPIRFELPMLVGQQLVNVQMSVQQEGQYSSEQARGQGTSDQAYSVLFALELSGLGKLRVDASISDASVHARIYSDQAGVGQFIREHIQRLETRLQDLGYKEVFLLATQMAPDTEKQKRFDQLTQMAPASLNLLDVIA